MAIRKRVGRSFLALAVILLVACVSSYLELIMLSNSSKNLIKIGAENIKISTELLDLSKLHNDIFFEYYQSQEKEKNKALLVRRSENILNSLDSLTNAASPDVEKHLSTILDDIGMYKKGVRYYYDNNFSRDWYHHFQSDTYFKFVKSTKQYMLLSQKYVVEETTKVYNGIYRSIMLGIVAIIFMIIILAIFFSLLDVYYLKPIVKLTRSLDSYLVSNKPFVVKVDGKDEVYHLKELILDLISENKSLKRELKKDNTNE